MSPDPAVRIAHVIAPVAFGGGEALLTALLARKVPDVDETVITVGRAPLLADALESVGIACHSLGCREVGAERSGRLAELVRSAALRRELRDRLAELEPTVVHAHGFPPSLLIAVAALANTRRVYTHHYERRPPGAAERQALTRVFNRYDACTTPADHLTDAMNRHFPRLRRPFTTLRIGIDERFFSGTPRATWRERFAPGTAVGVCVGRLVATKNQRLIVDALDSLTPDERRGIGILLVGDGPDEDLLRDRIAAAGVGDHVQLVGQVPREVMPDLLASVDFGVFPSTTEASSVAAAEALAAGLPVLALDIPSMVESAGSAGVFGGEDDFPRRLLDLSHRHAAMAPLARRQAEASRVSRVRQDWLGFYRDVVGVEEPVGA